MGKIILYIFLAGCCVIGCGCQEKQRKRRTASVEGITLKDVQPVGSGKTKPEVAIDVVTFEVPRENWTGSEDIFAELTTQPIRFLNQKALNANGITVGAGNNITWAKVAEQLNRLSATKAKTSKILLYDELTNDLAVTMISAKNVDYTNQKGQLSKLLLDNGVLSWRMQARSHIVQSGTAVLSVSAVFNYQFSMSLQRIAPKDMLEVNLKATAFEMAIRPGGFILLGPADNDAGLNTLGKSLFAGRDETVRLYLVLCVRVTN